MFFIKTEVQLVAWESLTVSTEMQQLSGVFERLLIGGNINRKAVKLIKYY